jgi:hypothetical protein
VIDSQSVIITPDIALAYFSAAAPVIPAGGSPADGGEGPLPAGGTTTSSRKTEKSYAGNWVTTE